MKPRRHEIAFDGDDLAAVDALVEQRYFRRIVHELSATLYTLSSAHSDLKSVQLAQPYAGAMKVAVSAERLLRFQVGELVALHEGALSVPDTQGVASLREISDTAYAVCEPWCIERGTRLRMVGSDVELVANRQRLSRICVLAVLLLVQRFGAKSIAVRLCGSQRTGSTLISVRAVGGGQDPAASLVRLLERSASDVRGGAATKADRYAEWAYMILRTVHALAGTMFVADARGGRCVVHFLLGRQPR